MGNIKNLFKNNTVKKILLFFNENPSCIDTAKGISLWVGSDTTLTQKCLNKLVKEGILIIHQAASTSAYAYTNNKAIVKNIEKYIKNIQGL